jgi:hypothetical protein
MKLHSYPTRAWLTGVLLLSLLSVSVRAATNILDFNTDPVPLGIYTEPGGQSAEWRPTGGNGTGGNDGFLVVTRAAGGQGGLLVFKDLENGLVVKAFKFECDVRIGGGTARPADGFSINYASASDPATTAGGQFAGTTTEPAPSALAEEGTQTGLAIGFDTWESGDPIAGVGDVVGLSVRVDGTLIAQFPVPIRQGNTYLPTMPHYPNQGTAYEYNEVPYRNLATNDANYPFALQTGALNTTDDLNGDGTVDGGDAGSTQPTSDDPSYPLWYKNLKWERFTAELTTNSTVIITYKGREITPTGGLATTFNPRAGRIILAARTGGAWEVHHVDNIRLVTIPADTIVIGNAVPSPSGFTINVSDSGPSVADTNTIVLKLDGAAITASSITKDTSGLTTITYSTLPNFFAPNSKHTNEITLKDTRGVTVSGVRIFTVPNYTTIPDTFALTGVDKTKPGFLVRAWQVATGLANNNDRSEQELDGELGPNIADVSTFTDNGYFDETTVINYWDTGGVGDFPSDTPNMPGIASPGDNYALEFLTALEFTSIGTYTMGVNSDDGFRVHTGKNLLDRFQIDDLMLGEFNGGRGVADTLFTFVIKTPGIYPFRMTFEEGGGGSAVEWFMVNPDGTKVLINDTATASAIKAYRRATTDRLYVKSIRPGAGISTASPTGKVEVVLVDANTKLAPGSVKMKFDGADVTPNVNSAAGTTTISYDPGTLGSLTAHSVSASFDENPAPGTNATRTVSFSFTVRSLTPDELPTNSFWIEAEDFDTGSGQHQTLADTMPYAGGAYDTLGAVNNVDYTNDDGTDSPLYRDPNLNPHVNMDAYTGTAFQGQGTATRRPGGFDVTTNYKIGWIGAPDWGNYTRNLPNGIYQVYAALSYDDVGTAGRLTAKLSKVTAGVGTTSQTLVDLGTFNAPGTAGWGNSSLVKMKSSDGSDAAVKLGGVTTLRFTSTSGDFDWYVLAPVIAPAKLIGGPSVDAPRSAYGGSNPRNAISFTLTDLSTAVVTNSIKLVLDGTDVSSGLAITKSGDFTTVRYAPAAGLSVGSHSYTLTFVDSGTPPKTNNVTGAFTADVRGSSSQFLIEAEDFDYDSGKTQAAASTMPYTGNAYNNLSAVHNVDYVNDDGNDSDLYRKTEAPNVNMDNGPGDVNRGTWTMTVNYKIGWVGSPDWQNYTRTIPANSYQIWAALSYDDFGGANRLTGSMGLVTAGLGTTNQTVQDLGTFNAAGTGGWGINGLVPMKDAGGNVASVALGGAQTLRYTATSGDTDYFLLVPAPPSGPMLTATRSGANLTISWSPTGGSLESTPVLQGATTVWTTVGTANPATVSIGTGTLFYRVKK